MCNIKIYSSAPNLFGTRDQFHGRQFFHRSGGQGMVSELFKHITLTVPFISIIITSAPPQILEV